MHISEIIKSRQLSTEQLDKNLKPTVQLATGGSGIDDRNLTSDEALACDIGLSDYADLMSPQFKAWYCKVWYKIGRERFAVLASQARADGKDPRKLFSYLLRKELSK